MSHTLLSQYHSNQTDPHFQPIFDSSHSTPYSSPCHSTLCPTHPRVTALYALLVNISHITHISSSVPCVHPVSQHSLPYSDGPTSASVDKICESHISQHSVPLRDASNHLRLFTPCVCPTSHKHRVPYSCTSTSSQTAPHRSHNKRCPTVVPHLHLHKLLSLIHI